MRYANLNLVGSLDRKYVLIRSLSTWTSLTLLQVCRCWIWPRWSSCSTYLIFAIYPNPANQYYLVRWRRTFHTSLPVVLILTKQIRLDIQVDEKTGKIVKSAFKTFGCGSAIASSSYLTTLLAGKTCSSPSLFALSSNLKQTTDLCWWWCSGRSRQNPKHANRKWALLATSQTSLLSIGGRRHQSRY